MAGKWDARDTARIAVFAAIIVALGLAGPIQVPGAVPITLQTLGVMLAGVVLGATRGGAAVLVVFALVAVGLPVLSGGRGGLGVFVGPTAGYLIGWLPAVVIAGLLAHAGARRIVWWRVALGVVVGGIGGGYALGIPGVALVTGIALPEAALSALAFLPGDLIKAALATVLALALYRAYPRAFPERIRGARARPRRDHVQAEDADAVASPQAGDIPPRRRTRDDAHSLTHDARRGAIARGDDENSTYAQRPSTGERLAVARPCIRATGLGVAIDGAAILDDVTVDLDQRRIAVIGANGSGKSTFARTLNGLVKATAGSLEVAGVDVVRDPRAARDAVGFLFSNPDAQILMPTPVEDLALSFSAANIPRHERTARALDELERIGLATRAEQPAYSLSGGQKQMLALAGVLARKPRVLVADEPTTLLDLGNARMIGDLLVGGAAEQVVIVTHDLELAARCDVCLRFDGGRLIEIGEPETVIARYRAVFT